MEKQLLEKKEVERKLTIPPKVFLRKVRENRCFFFFQDDRKFHSTSGKRESRAIFVHCKQNRLLHFSRIYFSIRPMLSVEVLSRSEFFERDTPHREIIFHEARWKVSLVETKN